MNDDFKGHSTEADRASFEQDDSENTLFIEPSALLFLSCSEVNHTRHENTEWEKRRERERKRERTRERTQVTIVQFEILHMSCFTIFCPRVLLSYEFLPYYVSVMWPRILVYARRDLVESGPVWSLVGKSTW